MLGVSLELAVEASCWCDQKSLGIFVATGVRVSLVIIISKQYIMPVLAAAQNLSVYHPSFTTRIRIVWYSIRLIIIASLLFSIALVPTMVMYHTMATFNLLYRNQHNYYITRKTNKNSEQVIDVLRQQQTRKNFGF